jgi:DNA-directed RNA polymerase specialized sigma24 family protein
MKLASTLTDTLGKVVYFELIKAGVADMPDVNGAPASEFVEKHPRNPERLPTGYGRKLADRIYAMLLSKTRNPDAVEEILSNYLVTVSRKGIPVPSTEPLEKAEKYVARSILNALSDYIRGEEGREDRGGKKPKLRSLNEETPEGQERFVNLSDPDAFRHLDNMLPHSDLQRLMKDLERINPRAVSWLEAQLEGVSNVDLAAEWGVGKSAIN